MNMYISIYIEMSLAMHLAREAYHYVIEIHPKARE
jgi:hypothetical protein